LAVARHNLSQAEAIVTSRSPRFDACSGFFFIQSGVVPWEEPTPRADWSAKSLSLVMVNLPRLESAFKWVLMSVFDRAAIPLRVHVADLPVGVGATVIERLLRGLRTDLPGTGRTVVQRLSADRVCAIAQVVRPGDFSIEQLSAYRSTVMLASPEALTIGGLVEVLSTLEDGFDGRALVALGERFPETAIVRILALETHAVFQAIGNSRVISRCESLLSKSGLGRLHDSKDIPDAILRLTGRR